MKKLRRKLISIAFFSSLCAFLAVSWIIHMSISIYQNYETDTKTELISLNDGTYPMKSEFEELDDADDIKKRIKYSEESFFTARYFVVNRDESDVYSIVTLNVASLSESDAIELAQSLSKSHQSVGFKNSYRYRIVKTEDEGIYYIFLDCTDMIHFRHSVLYISITVALLFTLLITLIFTVLAKQVLHPFEENNKLQKQFITDASHELKTPLAIIQANAQVLQYKNGANEWTDNIVTQTKRMNEMVADLLTLSRMEEVGETALDSGVNISDIARQTVDSLMENFNNKNVTSAVNISPNIVANVNLSQIKQMFSLLTENAAKYVTEGGELRISLAKSGRNISYRIYNSANIAEDANLNRFFDRFYRSDDSRNSSTGGHGIGLSVAQRIAKNHGGNIVAKREPGGICFTATVSANLKITADNKKVSK